MSKELVINANSHETRVAFVEDGNLRELFIERPKEANIAGNIYKGRVARVLPGMEAAFVDIGLDQAAFLYVADVVNDQQEFDYFMQLEPHRDEDDDGDAADAGPGGQYWNHCLIQDLLHEGQEIIVRVSKAPIGKKGSRVTTRVSLPGHFLVLMPTTAHIGVSRRIEDEDERARLKEILAEVRPGQHGVIARTVSEGVDREKLAKEMEFLASVWLDIQKKATSGPVPSLLHKELNVTLRAVRDLFTREVDKLVIDSKSGYEEILQFLDKWMPSLKVCVELYEESEPIFDAYNLESEISRALKRKVWLKSGGYIVIEHTEALVAIDVNTGRYVGRQNLEETILKTNLEAVKEIAYQIRLRDLGGLIIIDFIDMERKSNRERVFNVLTEALKKDRSKTLVLPMSELGLIQMTRKRTRETLNRMLCEPCFYCEGEGYLKSKRTICYNIHREIRREAGEMLAPFITLKVHPDIAELLLGDDSSVIDSLEADLNRKIIVGPDPHFHLEQYELYEMHGEGRIPQEFRGREPGI